MRKSGVSSRVLVAAAAFFVLLAGGNVLAVGAGAAPVGVQQVGTDPEPVPTDPTPDPAPTPAPKPKPKPAPKPAPRSKPPAQTPTYSAPSYTPAPKKTRSTKRNIAKKPRQKAKAVVPTVERPLRSTPDSVIVDPIRVGARQDSISASGDAFVTQILFIGGVTFAALLFLLAATVPGTAVRFTPMGRVVIEHQQDFVLIGLASLVITLFVYVLTGHGV